MSGPTTTVSVNGEMWAWFERKVPVHVPCRLASGDAAAAMIRLWSPVWLVRGSSTAPTVDAGSIRRRASMNFALVIVFLDLSRRVIHFEPALLDLYERRHRRHTERIH